MTEDALRQRIESLRRELRAAELQLHALGGPAREVAADYGGSAAPALEAAQQEILANERLLRAIFDGALDAMVIVDDRNRCVDANKAACALIGLPKKQLIGRGLREFAAPDYRFVANAWETFLADGSMRGQYPITRADGTRRELDYAAVANVLPGLHLSVLRDVTDRNAAERALRQTQQRLQAVAANLPIIFFAVDRDGIYTLHEGRGVELLGLRPGELVGRSYQERHQKNPGAAAAIERALAGEQVIGTFDVDGVPFESTCTPIRDAQGNVDGVAGVALDISARRSAEVALRRSEARFRAMIEKSQDAISLTDADGRPVYHSPAVERLLGYTIEESRNQPWSDLVARDELPRLRAASAQLLATPSGAIRIEFQVRRKDGQMRWFDLAATNLLHDPDVNAVVSNFRDVTHSKQAERELKALASSLQSAREEERAHLAREIHDELGQQLTAMKMDIGWIDRRLGTGVGPELRERLRAMSALVDDTVTAVRRMATQLRPGILDDLGLAAAIEWHAREFQARSGIDVALEVSDNGERISGATAIALFRVFQELLTNVARHAQARHVDVQLFCDDARVRLAVGDDGKGFDAAGGSGEPGRGLGLVGVRERLALLGGRVAIESRPGAGTTVRVEAPLAPPGGAP